VGLIVSAFTFRLITIYAHVEDGGDTHDQSRVNVIVCATAAAADRRVWCRRRDRANITRKNVDVLRPSSSVE
jgi:hypothetical protein